MKNFYRMKYDGTCGELIGQYENLSDIIRIMGDGTIKTIDRIGGKRHHMFSAWGFHGRDKNILIDGDTNYPR